MKKLVLIMTLLCISLLITTNAIAKVKVLIEDNNPAAKNPTISYRSEEEKPAISEKPKEMLPEVRKPTFMSAVKSDLSKFNGKSSLACLAGGLALGYGVAAPEKSSNKSLAIGGGLVTVIGIFNDDDSAIMKTLFLIAGVTVGYIQGDKAHNAHKTPSWPADGPSPPPSNIKLMLNF